MANESECFSCGALVKECEGPTHRYLGSSPGCWAAFGEVLTLEYSDMAYGKNHRLTVDAYALQHPGEPSPQTIRSAVIHLASLHLVFDRGKEPHEATRLMQKLAQRKSVFSWLDPPEILGEVTVADVLAATDAQSHLQRVEEWARAAWTAWRRHHAKVEEWIALSL